jgi:hypothetical protein
MPPSGISARQERGWAWRQRPRPPRDVSGAQ